MKKKSRKSKTLKKKIILLRKKRIYDGTEILMPNYMYASSCRAPKSFI